MKILHLTLKKKWFDQIAEGKKIVEYREVKPYWNKRLKGKKFDEIYFRNGYSSSAPFMKVECKGINIRKVQILNDKPYYCIALGKVLELKQ
ncbi:MAG: ASCH domain-containing protein [Patescibacteria group bacterium]|nr:ASCH domain-containing protein [Patescibacteria group bacterium]